MATQKKENKIELIEIPEIKREVFEVTIIGDTPLLSHKFADKQKADMLDKQMKKEKVKTRRNPVADFCESIYWLSDKPEIDYEQEPGDTEKIFNEAIKKGAKFGFPSTSIKKASAQAGYRAGITSDVVTTLGFFHIVGSNLIEIISDVPEIQEDTVRLPNGSADIRYRARFDNWKMTFKVLCSPHLFPKEKVLGLINLAGFSVGIGDWRPEKKGNFGTFHVATSDEV
jgi:hypothetical protein